MTTTPTTTCPAWCTFDHAASAQRMRDLYAKDVAQGFPDSPADRARLEVDVQANQEFNHSRAFGAYVEIVEDATAQPTIAVWSDEEDRYSAGDARAFAAKPLAAADKLDEILSAS